MLKIPKGLKKKKKGKKSKHKDEELFDSAELAELEQYKKEQQKKQEEAAAAAAAAAASTSEAPVEEDSEKGEEWEKFKALTSGVDDILKKTQGDLDRIKSTSYFQKKPPGPSVSANESANPPTKAEVKPVKGKWVGFEESICQDDQDEPEPHPEVPEQVTPVEPEKVEEEDEEESEFEDDQDDIFDTSYVDVVASGEVKLAYVPDSPVEPDDFDPFDTSIVDKVIKTDPKQKKLVSLGCAVEVLTGKLEKPVGTPPLEITKPQRRRPRPQDLLLGSFDEGSTSSAGLEVEPEPAPRSILDDDPVFEEKTSEILGLPPVTPIAEVAKPTPSPVPPPTKEKETKLDLKNLVEEFVEFSNTSTVETLLPKESLEDDLEDEFAALAAESISKKHQEEPKKVEDDFNFEDDPFDTSFAAQVLPGKFEIKLIEKEILNGEVPEITTDPNTKLREVLQNSELSHPPKVPGPLNDFQLKPVTIKDRDLLGGSTTDLSQISQEPIAPKPKTEEINEFTVEDPFDTSVIDKIVAPGVTTLKYLEKELLDSSTVSSNVPVDDDFNPRADESSGKPPRPDNLTVGDKRTSVPKVVAFNIKSPSNLPDLLAVDQDENSKVSKPLTPYYPIPGVQQEDQSIGQEDPFDTSFVSHAPGKVELQLLEKELVSEKTLETTTDLSDEEFDPRGNEPNPPLTVKPTVLQVQPDIISGEVVTEVKLHTPVVPRKIEEELDLQNDIDPFDTSIVSGLIPGKAEIKVLETELIYSQCAPSVSVPCSAITEALIRKSSQSSSNSRPSVTDVLEVASSTEEIAVKPLTPVTVGSFEFDDSVDPFDTSAVGDILPGKTEIKLLESELMLN